MTSSKTIKSDPAMFFLVNPISGGNAAAIFTEIGLKHLSFSEEDLQSEIYIYDIRDGKHADKPAFHHIRERVKSTQVKEGTTPVRIIVAGGDGTVMWAISEAQAHGVNIDKVAFGVVPYGTGNDFARSLGWGGTNPSKAILNSGMKRFKAMIREFLTAEVTDFDIWKVDVKVREDGGQIKQVKQGAKEVMVDSNGAAKKDVSKLMCNYFSIGIESRIGLGFDKNRTTSTFLNKMRYGIEGVKKMFTSTPRIGDLIESCTIGDKDHRVLFSTNKNSSAEPSVPHLRGNPVSLIFLNINSFAGGCDLWALAHKSGLVSGDTSGLMHQSVGDRKLEVLTYDHLLGLSLEQSKSKIMGGNGRGVAQDGGPFVLQFKENLGSRRTYLQIDGEFFTLDKSEKVTITHNMVVKVLKKRNDLP